MDAIENFIGHQTSVAAKETGEGAAFHVVYIPVVIHVLYNSNSENLSDAQLKSQIDALNRDYRRKNSDSSSTPARFKGVAADVQIEFVLATADPAGRATTGIVRKHTSVTQWKADDAIKFSAQGGDNAWDSRFYLNFWVGNLRSLLGYSSVPGGPADMDGIVISTGAFGTLDRSGPYAMGRTAVHEAGHWLGLKHIWGDTYCGDDGVSDTPPQGNFTAGCPGGSFRSSCNNGTLGDMYMNFMDFTDDACMNLFTDGQKQRMLALFNPGGPRYTLLQSRGLNEPWNHEPLVPEANPVNQLFGFYPNPATEQMTLNLSESWVGKNISIVNVNGTVVFSIQVSTQHQKISVGSLARGLYFIQGEAAGEKVRQKFIKL